MKEREIKMMKKNAIVVGKGKVRKTRPRATPLDALFYRKRPLFTYLQMKVVW